MHTKHWQAVCGYLTDGCESLMATSMTMKDLFYAITEQNYVMMSWTDGRHTIQLHSAEFRKKVISIAHKLQSVLGNQSGMVGLHLKNRPVWPAIFWGILMSGHIPLIMDPRHELFFYRDLPRTANLACITEDRQYPSVILPDELLSDTFSADAALFEKCWADEVVFAVAEDNGKTTAVRHNGASLCGQILRLGHLYRSGLPLIYPKSEGPLKAAINNSFSSMSGFLPAVIWYPYFGVEECFIHTDDVGELCDTCRTFGTTHLFASGQVFDLLAATVMDMLDQVAPKLSGEITDWLTGNAVINNFNRLSQFLSVSAKLIKRVFGKKMRCLVSIGSAPKDQTVKIFNHLGLVFSKGYCSAEFGIVTMDLSEHAEERCDGSFGHFLSGVAGTVGEDGKLLLSGDCHAAGYLGERDDVPITEPYQTGLSATIDMHGKLRLSEANSEKSESSLYEPETEKKVRSLYAVILGIPLENIGSGMHFFMDLGGDSLSYFMLLQHIEVDFGVRLLPEERIYMTTSRHAAEVLYKYQRKKDM